jgi:hypothetical protein
MGSWALQKFAKIFANEFTQIKIAEIMGKNDEPEAEHNSSPNSKWEKTGKLAKVNWA